MNVYSKPPRAIKVKRDERNGMGSVLTNQWEECSKDTPGAYYNAYWVFRAISNMQDMVGNNHDFELLEKVKQRINEWMDRH